MISRSKTNKFYVIIQFSCILHHDSILMGSSVKNPGQKNPTLKQLDQFFLILDFYDIFYKNKK